MTIIRVAQHKPEHMTVRAARARFTLEERVGIEAAAEHSPLVRVFLADLASSLYVDRYDEQFVAGLEELENAGLIAQGRAQEIQSAPVQDHERHSPA